MLAAGGCALAGLVAEHPQLAVPAGNPGLRTADGSPREPHTPNFAPRIIDVVQRATELGCRIDLADDAQHDDAACIEAVLDDASTTSGSTVFFPNGTYNLQAGSAHQRNAHIVLRRSGVNLQGESREGTVLKSGRDDGGMATYIGLQLLGVHDVVVRDLTVTSNWNGFPYQPVTRGNNPTRGGLTHAIAMSYAADAGMAHNITIDNVLVERFRRMGVRIDRGSHDIVVRNSMARNATDVGDGGAGYGFVIQGGGHRTAASNPFLGSEASDTYFVLLENNRTEGPYIRHAALVQYWAHHNLITRNVFKDTQLDAIDLHGEDEYANEISFNVVQGSLGAGIGLGNSGAGHDKTGVHNWLHHNELVSCAWGITVRYGTDYTTIEHNTIRDSDSHVQRPIGGVVLGKSSHGVLRNNLFKNNGVPGYSAIVLMDDDAEGEEAAGGPSYWSIRGNHVVRSGATLRRLDTRGTGNSIE